MSWRMILPSGGRICGNGLLCCCYCRFRDARGPPRPEPPTTTPMTEEEKERFDDLENLLPCHIYRVQEKDESNEEGSRTYHLYDGFNYHENQDEAQPQQPLSLRLHQEECSICLMEYEDGDKLTSSHNPKCHHAFHRECMKRWLVSNSECPCCRKGFLEFEDSDNENEATPLANRFAALTTSFQEQVRQVRQGLETRLEPIIVRLEQERQATIDPDNRDRRRTATNNRGAGYPDTRYQSDDDEGDRSDDHPTMFQHRIDRLREGLSDQLDNLRVRMMEQSTLATQRPENVNADASVAASSSISYNRSGVEDRQVQTTTTAGTGSAADDDQQGPQPNLLAATTRVLEIGSARWKDVSTRIVLLGQSFRGTEEPSSESNPGSPPSIQSSESNPTT